MNFLQARPVAHQKIHWGNSSKGNVFVKINTDVQRASTVK